MAPGEARRVGPTCVLAALLSAHALVQVACVTSALLGVTITRGRAATAVGLCVVTSLLFGSRFTELPGPRRVSGSHRDRRLNRIVWIAAASALVWTVTMWARLWLLAYERPSYDWDGLYYHIPAIHEWVVAGHVRWIDTYPDVPFVNYPMGVEAQSFLMHQLLGLSRLVDACNLWYWPLAVIAIVVLAQALGARGPWRWLAAALVAGAPVMVCQGVTSYTDPAFAACVMAAVAATLLLVFHDDDRPWWKAVLWGGSVGLVLGAKGTGLPASVVLGLGVLGGALWHEGRCRWAQWLPRVVAGAILALAIGGYWYARSGYHTGNPVYPIEVKFGTRVLVAGYDASSFTSANQPEWLTRFPPVLRTPVSWLQLDAPVQGYAPVGGLGYIWPIFEIPALVTLAALAARRRLGAADAKVLFALGLAAILLAVQPALWWARFTVWVHAVGLACVAVVLQRGSAARLASARIATAACVLAAVGLAMWESERTLAIEQARGRVPSSTGRRASYVGSVQMLLPGLAETRGFDRFLAAERIARSRWGSAGTLLGGILATPLGERQIHLLPREPGADDLERLEAAGVRWVIWDVAGSGKVPAFLRERSTEDWSFTSAPAEEFHILFLGSGGR